MSRRKKDEFPWPFHEANEDEVFITREKDREAKKQEKFLTRRKKIWEKHTATTSAPLKRVKEDEFPEAEDQ